MEGSIALSGAEDPGVTCDSCRDASEDGGKLKESVSGVTASSRSAVEKAFDSWQ